MQTSSDRVHMSFDHVSLVSSIPSGSYTVVLLFHGLGKGPWAIQFLVLGRPSSVGYGFRLVEWAFSQIRYQFLPQVLCHHCPSYFAGRELL